MKRDRFSSTRCSIAVILATLAVGTCGWAEETIPEGLKLVSVTAQPAAIQLQHKFAYVQLLLTGQLDSGETVDLSRQARLTRPATTVLVSPTGQVRPRTDGKEQLQFEVAGHSIAVPVTVTGVTAAYPVSFVRDVAPALSRLGCNAGTCHGSKDGKNGFKLSLRGYDYLLDHRSLTDDIAARRLNRAAPDQSLMLLKASGSIPHVGGLLTGPEEPYYELLRTWIAGGAALDLDRPRVSKIELFPRNPVLPRAGMQQQMVVTATYGDGSVRDVTAEAFIESGNIEVVEAGRQGLLTMLRRGEAAVLARYEGAYTATTITIMGDRSGFNWQPPPVHNYIDELVDAKLQRVKILPGELCTDEEFIRRVYLDLVGLPPSVEEVRAFLADARQRRVKRDELIDRLVGNDTFVEHWTNKWADLLQVNRKFLGAQGALALRDWIKQSVASNKPYDKFAYEILTAGGSTMQNPAAAYWKIHREPADLMENTTHLFLAIRFNCNKCHDHPFERWTQDQYYHLAAYFAQVGRKEDPQFAGKKIGKTAVMKDVPLVEMIQDVASGDVTHLRTGEKADPLFPYEHAGQLAAAATRRETLANWITAPANPYFARSYVNRLWGYLLGVGIIEPIDDIRAGNPPTNPELLDALTADFVGSGFDVQHILRTICRSRTYQQAVRSNQWNEDDRINYSHALPRRLPAEVLFDAIHVATGATSRIPGVPAGLRAAALPDAGITLPFLDEFGRPSRESACECDRSSGVVLGPIMKLVNGPTVANALADPNNALAKLVAAEADDRKVIGEVYLRLLARNPTEKEIELGIEALHAGKAEHAEHVARLEAYEKTLPAKQAEWEKGLSATPQWSVLELTEMTSQVGATFTRQEDQSILVAGKNGKDLYTLVAPTDLTGITAIRLEALPDPTLPAGGPGRAKNGNFVINEFRITVAPKSDPARAGDVKLQSASAEFSQQSWDVGGAIDGNEASGWAVSPQFNKPHVAIFETKEDIGFDDGSVLTISVQQHFQDGQHSLGRFRLSATRAPRPVGVNRLPPDVAQIIATEAQQRTPAQQATLRAHFRSQDTELARLTAAVKTAGAQSQNERLMGVQDVAWALINSPAFLFNR